MPPTRLCLEPPQTEGDVLVLAARLESPEGPPLRLWWRLPASWADAVTPWADPFVVALLFPMMQAGREVLVEGRVSPSLLANLEQYMAIWHMWRPEEYRPVSIRATEEAEAPPPEQSGQAVMSFSCGVDSSFTVHRHCRQLVGRRNRSIEAAAVMNGFDIWLDQENAPAMYAGLLSGARTMLDSLGVACIPMTSNFHELPTTWGDSYGTQLVSGLRLLSRSFDTAILANSLPYSRLFIPQGNHPVTDPWLSSRAFAVIDDGGEHTRFEKVRLIAQWPEARQHLRVCFENPGSHANCCRCEKCIRTMMAFRVAGCPLPPAFPHDVSDRQIRRMHFNEVRARQWKEAARGAQAQGLGKASWVRAARAAVRHNRIRWFIKDLKSPFIPLRNRLRVIFRGSAVGRRARSAAARRQTDPSRS